MKKGFTLVEMLAVVLLISFISILVIPSILNLVSNKKEEISNISRENIFSSTSRYLESNTINFPKEIGKIYCVSLQFLSNKGEIETPYIDPVTKNEIAINTLISAKLNAYSEYEYCIIGSSGCVVKEDNCMIICKNDSCINR